MYSVYVKNAIIFLSCVFFLKTINVDAEIWTSGSFSSHAVVAGMDHSLVVISFVPSPLQDGIETLSHDLLVEVANLIVNLGDEAKKGTPINPE